MWPDCCVCNDNDNNSGIGGVDGDYVCISWRFTVDAQVR
jgi:hypothetical protein